MKLLMVTRANDFTIEEYGKHTLPILKMFAKKWTADFKILDDSMIVDRWQLLLLNDFLAVYDRILYVDSDIVINRNCPNIFDAVPFDTVGTVFEDKGSRRKARQKLMEKIKQKFGGNEHWTRDYFNEGVILFSKPHRDMLTKINGQYWEGQFTEQTHLNYQMMKCGYKYIDLGYRWNHMFIFSEPWNGSPSRFDSYIIHYAGAAKFPDKGDRSRIQLIEDDIKKIYGSNTGDT